MKTLQARITVSLIALISLFTLSGCEEWSFNDIYGEWRIVEVSGDYNCNYQPGDRWFFDSNGDFMARGIDGLYEQGYWERSGKTIYISFESYDPEIVARIKVYDDNYMVLYVDDYTYNSRYTLRLVNDYYYSQKKNGGNTTK